MKGTSHAVICIGAALGTLGMARLFDLWGFPNGYFSSEQFGDPLFLWRVTLPRIFVAVPLGGLCWFVLRRPSWVVGVVYLLVTIPLLIAYIVVPLRDRYDFYRRLSPFQLNYANTYATLSLVAAVGVACLISTLVSRHQSSSNPGAAAVIIYLTHPFFMLFSSLKGKWYEQKPPTP